MEKEDTNRRQERKSDNEEELCFPIENEKGNHDDIFDEVVIERERKHSVNQEQEIDVKKTSISREVTRKKKEEEVTLSKCVRIQSLFLNPVGDLLYSSASDFRILGWIPNLFNGSISRLHPDS